MIIRNMRWGYDGGGMACGPVGGNSIVEVCFTGNDKHNYFVVVSQMDGFERVSVCPLPMFDILMYMMRYDVEFENELEKFNKNIIEDYDYELGDEPEEMSRSKFARVIHLARLAMQKYMDLDDPGSETAAAEEFIKPYVDEDIEEVDLPELEEEIDEDEWDEEPDEE